MFFTISRRTLTSKSIKIQETLTESIEMALTWLASSQNIQGLIINCGKYTFHLN